MRDEYERLRAAHLSAIAAALEDHVQRVSWSRPQIERYRAARLRAFVDYARERSPFHARRWGDRPVASVADLGRLPVMTKQDAQANWDEIVTVPNLDRAAAERILASQEWFSYTPGDVQIFSSGGSSGVRGVYAWGWDFLVSAACLAWRTQAAAERSAPGGNARLAVLAAGTPPHASTPLFDVPTTPGMTTVVVPVGGPFGEIRAAVAAAQPTHLVGYASVIGQLARSALAGELSIRPVRVSTNSEPLLAEDLSAIEQAWSAPVHNLWGSTEIGVQAVGCGFGGLHICEDEVVLERVDDEGLPVADGEPAARTLATGLANRVFPFVRYDLGDQVDVRPGPCPCGSAFTRVADVAGRRDDDFRYGDIVVPASAFRYVLGTDPRVSEYQVEQTAKGATIRVVGAPNAGALTEDVEAALQRQGLRAPVVVVEIVDHLERHRSTGKLKRFVPVDR